MQPTGLERDGTASGDDHVVEHAHERASVGLDDRAVDLDGERHVRLGAEQAVVAVAPVLDREHQLRRAGDGRGRLGRGHVEIGLARTERSGHCGYRTTAGEQWCEQQDDRDVARPAYAAPPHAARLAPTASAYVSAVRRATSAQS